MDQKKVVTLAGTLLLAGVVVAAGVYGPSTWKVLRQQSANADQVVIQTPPVDSIGTNAASGTSGADGTSGTSGTNSTLPDGTAPPGTPGKATPTTTTTTTDTSSGTLNASPQGETGSKNKYREPDTKLMDLAPSIATFFGETALSNDAKTLAFGTTWNVHEYVDGYLFGPTAGPQMNEQDIKKYILFHKTLWDKQLKNEPNASKATVFTNYFDVLLNSGIDAFDSKDKARIEQFHQGIHDLDTHLMRNDVNSKIYGATPFATKRT